MSEDIQAQSDAADQTEDTSTDDLDTNDDADTGADDTASDDAGDEGDQGTEGDDAAGDEGGFEAKFKDQQGRARKFEGQAKTYRQRLIAAGLDPETGKPKEDKSRDPNKDDAALSQEQESRIAKAEERAERAELRALGITHADDIQFVRDAAKRLGVDVMEAAEDEIVKSKLERQRATRKTKDNTPSPTKGHGTAPKKGKTAWDMSDEEFQKERSRIMSGS